MTQDGDLTYRYDKNGNRVSVGYPGGVTATYSFDYADREASLTVDDGVSPQSVVTSASYLPSGPLTALTLGNGVTESRLFDGRYFPDSIEVTTPRSHLWDYTTDDVGNITSIVETEDCVPALTLANRTLIGQQTFVSCDDLSVGSDVTVAAGAEVTFRAGQRISLGSGFSVELGATFLAVPGSSSPKVSSFIYSYQDFQYFLRGADGPPWGALGWTYDRIGNRLTEDRNGSIDTYSYVSNGSGNTAILTQAGSRTYTTGGAGHVTSIADGGDQVDLPIDDAGRVAGFERPLATAETSFAYDGRGFLCRFEELLAGGPDNGFTEPTYSSEGVLRALHRQLSPSDPEERASVFYFAGRPVAQLRQEIGGPSTWLFLSTDRLGTPVLLTDLTAAEIWHGPIEPFGADFFGGTSESALAKGVLLRFPGQLEDEIWSGYIPGEFLYNVHRWYQPETGRYTRVDPVRLPLFAMGILKATDPVGSSRTFRDFAIESYGYSGLNPLGFVDPLGLAIARFTGCSSAQQQQIQTAAEAADAASDHPCFCGYPKDMFRRTIRNLHVKCVPWTVEPLTQEPACGSAAEWDSATQHVIYYTDTILITPAGLSNPHCGCLQGTIMHEVLHLIGVDHDDGQGGFNATKRCFSCD